MNCASPNFRRASLDWALELCGDGLASPFGSESDVDCVLSVCVRHVSHLGRLECSYTTGPALTRWANFCRTSGALNPPLPGTRRLAFADTLPPRLRVAKATKLRGGKRDNNGG